MLREKIQRLREQGKSYSQISDALGGISKATISYYLDPDGKEKVASRTRAIRARNPLVTRVDTFKRKQVGNRRVRDFQRRVPGRQRMLSAQIKTFSYQDVEKRLGRFTHCYLSGEPIDLYDASTYEVDHIVPASRGGSNLIDNFGVTHPAVNRMKDNLTVEELLHWCERILKYHGRMS